MHRRSDDEPGPRAWPTASTLDVTELWTYSLYSVAEEQGAGGLDPRVKAGGKALLSSSSSSSSSSSNIYSAPTGRENTGALQ